MKAFSKIERKPQKKLRDQKFKFIFKCEFELEPDEFWEDGEPPRREISVEDVLEHLEEQYCDALEFITHMVNKGCSIDSVEGDLDVTEVLPKEELKKEDDDDIFSNGAMIESTSLSEAVGKVVAGEAISEMVR